MKKYIFLTTAIASPGGSQCYLAAKAIYLESQGWNVHIFSPSSPYKKCLISSLEKYRNENILEISIPPFQLNQSIVKSKLEWMAKKIGNVLMNDEVIVESHEDTYAFWGEMLAFRLKGRHYTYLMNENYRNPNQFYETKMDFFLFKFKRREIMGSMVTLSRLFQGYLEVSPEDYSGNIKINESPVADVKNPKVDKIIRRDFNIAYLGRGNKSYVNNIILGIGNFAKTHSEKNIQFLAVSDLSGYKHQISRILNENKNLEYINLGYLHPIPQNLFNKIDAMIAGSGSARHSAEEGVPTIVADPELKLSIGILGYETMSSIMRGKDSIVSSFEDALERVLISKVYLNQVNRLPPKETIELSTKQNFNLFSQSAREKKYYSEEELLKGRKNNKEVFKKYIHFYITDLIYSIYRKIVNKFK